MSVNQDKLWGVEREGVRMGMGYSVWLFSQRSWGVIPAREQIETAYLVALNEADTKEEIYLMLVGRYNVAGDES